jgi:ribosomal protein S18 acetylase RimI-like enzyme
VALEWKHSSDGVDWEELSALYRAAPLGDKQPAHLQKVFANSMFKCFVYDDSKLVAAGRALADGGDCSYICDIAVLPSHQGPFYRKFGFLRMKTAMAIFENQQQQLERGYLSEA